MIAICSARAQDRSKHWHAPERRKAERQRNKPEEKTNEYMSACNLGGELFRQVGSVVEEIIHLRADVSRGEALSPFVLPLGVCPAILSQNTSRVGNITRPDMFA